MAAVHRLDTTHLNEQLTLKRQTGQGNTRSVLLNILHYKRLQSTNTTAYRLGEEGSPDWTIVAADIQTRGRGRANRKWESPKGGLWFSILLRPQVSSQRISLLQFLASTATRQAIEGQTGERVRLKWPNDIVLEGGKLGGILVESKTQGGKIEFAIVGIGVNVNQRKSKLPPGATSLFVASGHQCDQKSLLRAILEEMRRAVINLDNPSRVMGDWWRWCVHRPRLVQVTLPAGMISGITRGIEEDGSLLVETEHQGVQKVSEGSLRVLDD
jgi:BirA family biotin operon repressor/biotin-[acetyl-CoA-carboxylase] ligase